MAFTSTFVAIATLLGLGLGIFIGFFCGHATGYTNGWHERQHFNEPLRSAEDERRLRKWASIDRADFNSLRAEVTAGLRYSASTYATVQGWTNRAGQGAGLPVDVRHRPCRGSETLETPSDDSQRLSEGSTIHAEAKCQACTAAKGIFYLAHQRHSVPHFKRVVDDIRCPRHADHLRADGSAQAGVSSRTDR